MPREVKPALVRKQLLPGQSEALLKELHLIGRDGKIHADTLRKLNQVNHLTQFLLPALNDVRARYEHPVVVDAGAGNAYLGFVLYEMYLRDAADLLYSVETRPELVAKASERAHRLGYDRMRFLPTPLAELAGEATGELPERLHLLTALHACDTATDDALVLAIRRKADHIAVVPCCQAEVAAQLRKHQATPADEVWPLLWSHPIHAREFGAHLTNVIRTLVLQSFGYQVTVTELVGWEHSLKNELILARKVHREHRPSLLQLEKLLAVTGVRPKIVRELLPERPPTPPEPAPPSVI
jgi:hypothetical protein